MAATAVGRTALSRAPRLALQVAAVALLTAGGWWFALHGLQVHHIWHHTFDLRVYRGAVQWWLDGRPLYDFVRPHTSMGFTYPPFALLCLLPLALGTEVTATVLMTTVSAVALVVTTAWLMAPVARRHGWPVWFSVAVAVPVSALLEPVRETFGWGQVALILAILVMADVRALDRGKPWAGVGIGLAAAIKVTPAFFILYLLAARRWRAAATAAGTALAATLLAYAVGPADSVTYWTHALWDTKRVGDPTITTNQSLLGALGRLAAPGSASRLLWLALALAVAAIGLRRAGRAARAGDQLTGMTIAGITAAVVSPISWTHHFYWVVPAAFVLLDLAAGTRAAVRRPGLLRPAAAVGAAVVVLAFGSSLIWYFTGDTRFGHDGLIGTLGNNAYLLISLGLILLLPARVPEARAAARTPAPPIPAGSSPR